MKHAISLILASLALFVTLPAAASSEPVLKDGQPRYVQTRVIPEFTAVKPGSTLTLAIVQNIAAHWHVYWKNPGDSGEALRAKWELPEGFAAGEFQWQNPRRMPIGPLTNFGYSEKNIVLTDIAVPEKLSGKDVPIKVDLEWLVCEEICVPESTTILLTLPVVAADEEAIRTDPDLFADARASMPEDVAWPGMVTEQDGALTLSFTPDSDKLTEWQEATSIEFYPDEWGIMVNAAPQENTVSDGALHIKVQRDTRELKDLGGQITGIIVRENTDGVRSGVRVQVAVPAMPAVVEQLAEETMAENTPALKISFWQAIGLAFLGGLVLNLMPCVFPVLSIKALSLLKMSEREQSHAVMHGVMYTAGILLCFALIATTLIALQQAGKEIGWGFQLQNPIVVLLLAYLLFVIGLNLSGVFEISSSKLTNLGSKLTQKQGYAGSFFTGMLATIVATPCTAPYMGAALGYAVTQSPVKALSVFIVLGLGLALPYLLLTIVPALRKAMPRPGAWMETFRQFLAFPMYAFSAALVWVYSQQVTGGLGVLLAGLGIVFIAMGVWMWQNAPTKHPANAVIKVLAIGCFGFALAIAAISMMRPPQVVSATTEAPAAVIEHAGDWHPYTKVALDDALKGNDPVFVNMTASWCITCKVNEGVALSTDDTQKLFKDQKVLYLIGDWTNQNPEITAFLKGYGRTGVPIYVFYGSRDLTTNTRPDPVVLPQLLTPGVIADVVTYN